VTASYKVFVKPSVERELRGLPKQDLQRIDRRIGLLANEPRPPGCEKLSGEGDYRVRQGDYRIVYRVNDDEKVVEVIKVGHRREVYR